MDQHELGRVRQVALSPFDIKVLTTFVETGGEFPFYIDRLAPDTRDAQIAAMNSLIARDLIMVDKGQTSGHRWMLRLTDNGRAVCAQLEKMNAGKPAVQVQMRDGTPEVVKP